MTESEQNVWFGLKKFIYIVGLSTMATVGLVGLQLKKYQFSRRCQRITRSALVYICVNVPDRPASTLALVSAVFDRS